MSTETDVPFEAEAVAPAAMSKTRAFTWSVRRELWENRSVYIAPLAVAGLGLFGFLFSLRGLPHTVSVASMVASPGDLATLKAVAQAGHALAQPYDFVTGVVFVAGMIVAVFYCLAALHSERRDRSVLFWKSLPVSDLTTVLSKITIPLVVQLLVIFAVVIPTHLAMLLLSTVVLLINGMDPTALWPHLHLVMIWATLPYALLVIALWYAPVCGWLMLVSAWARRMPILWALAPPLGLSLFEFLAFHTTHLWSLLTYRLRGGFAEAFTVNGQGKVPIDRLDQINLLPFLSLPSLWAGLIFAAACLAGCVWLRRRSDPI